MSDIFDQNSARYDSWYDSNKYAYLSELKAVKEALPSEGKGLEIGVGTGRFAAPLGIKFGIDPSGKMLAIAKKRGVGVREGTGESIPFKDSYFDYAAMIITICFLKDTRKALQEVYRVLKKNGKIILGIVDKNSFLGRHYQKKKSVFYKQAKFFAVKELTELLQAEGFKDFSYYQTLYDFPERICKVQRVEKGYGKGGFVVISAFKK